MENSAKCKMYLVGALLLAIGETMFSAEAHRELFEKRAVAMCHPDIIFAGGCRNISRYGRYDYRWRSQSC